MIDRVAEGGKTCDGRDTLLLRSRFREVKMLQQRTSRACDDDEKQQRTVGLTGKQEGTELKKQTEKIVRIDKI